MIDALQLIEWFDSQVKRIDRLLEEKGYYVYHDMPELYESQLREQRHYYSMTIVALTRLVNSDKHFPKIEAWEVVKNKISIEKGSIDYANINIKDWNHHLTKDQYQTLKKALEVKDE